MLLTARVLFNILLGLWNLLWKPLVGGCDLRHTIEQALMNAGDWKVVEIGHDDTEPWQMMPRIWGHFVKP